MKTARLLTIIGAVALFLASGLTVTAGETITKIFEAKEIVKVSTVSGDLVVIAGETDKIEVEVVSRYRPRGSLRRSNAARAFSAASGFNMTCDKPL